MTNHRRTRAELLDALSEFGSTDRDQGVAVVSAQFPPLGSRAQDFDRQSRQNLSSSRAAKEQKMTGRRGQQFVATRYDCHLLFGASLIHCAVIYARIHILCLAVLARRSERLQFYRPVHGSLVAITRLRPRATHEPEYAFNPPTIQPREPLPAQEIGFLEASCSSACIVHRDR
jgi:hypothetical protein